MIVALALALTSIQDAAAQDDVEEVVIQAKLGLTTMLFDKGADGKLRNCRIMVSSGSQKRDTAACQATPVCYARTADVVTDCRELTILEQAALIAPAPPAPAVIDPGKFTVPKLTQPAAPVVTGIGPSLGVADADAADRNRVKKLPPPPSAPSDGPAVKLVLGDEQNPADNRP
jgi:hypothetical protein